MLKSKLRKLIFCSLVTILVIAVIGCGATSPTDTIAEDAKIEPIKLRYSFDGPAGSFPAVQMEQWAEEIEKRTDGLVTVETFPGAVLMSGADAWDGVLSGIAEVALSIPGFDPGRFPLTSGLSLPVAFPSSTVASLVMWDLFQEFKSAEFDEFKILTVFTTEPGYIQTIDPVRNLDDLQGMEIRAVGTGVPILRALGATPIGMPMPEVPEALQLGVIEGTMTSREILMDFKLAEVLKYVVDYPTVVVSFAAVMDKNLWESLPSNVQDVINELGREMALFTGQYHDNHVFNAMEWSIKEHGLQVNTLSPEEKARWDSRLEPLVEEWIKDAEQKGLPGQEFVDRLNELKDKYMEEYS